MVKKCNSIQLNNELYKVIVLSKRRKIKHAYTNVFSSATKPGTTISLKTTGKCQTLSMYRVPSV